jgi:Flp pilus assembly protein TadG
MRTRFVRNERGAALLETAITIPIILLIAVGIFEFGRAYQTSQVLTNAAREGARIAILSDKTAEDVNSVVEKYMSEGGLPCVGDDLPKACAGKKATVNVNRNVDMGVNSASRVTISYPFRFIVLNPVVQLISPGSQTGEPLNLQSVALMRNES